MFGIDEHFRGNQDQTMNITINESKESQSNEFADTKKSKRSKAFYSISTWQDIFPCIDIEFIFSEGRTNYSQANKMPWIGNPESTKITRTFR